MATRRQVAAWWFQNRMKKAGAGYSDEAQSVIDSFPNALTGGEADLIAAFVDANVANGNWAKMDSFAHFGMQDAANALWDWKRLSGMTAVNAPLHTPGISYGFNGTTQYIDSGYNPSVDAVNYQLDDSLVGVYVVDGGSNPNQTRLLGAFSTSEQLLIQNRTDRQNIQSIINCLGNANATPTLGAGQFPNNTLVSGLRTASNLQGISFNGVLDITDANASIALPNENIGIGNSVGLLDNYFQGTVSSFVVGSAIGFNHTDYYDNLVILNNGLSSL